MALEGGLDMPEQARRGRAGQARRRGRRGRRAGAPDRVARPDRKVSLPVHGGDPTALLLPLKPKKGDDTAIGGEERLSRARPGLEPDSVRHQESIRSSASGETKRVSESAGEPRRFLN